MSDSILHTKPQLAMPCLALRPREAAQAIGVSERTLWALTQSGKVPHAKIGRIVVYPTDQLRDWLAAQAKATATTKPENGAAEGGAE